MANEGLHWRSLHEALEATVPDGLSAALDTAELDGLGEAGLIWEWADPLSLPDRPFVALLFAGRHALEYPVMPATGDGAILETKQVLFELYVDGGQDVAAAYMGVLMRYLRDLMVTVGALVEGATLTRWKLGGQPEMREIEAQRPNSHLWRISVPVEATLQW